MLATSIKTDPSKIDGVTRAPDIKHVSSSEQRIIIRKIVLENFKSYAGVQEIGPFHQVTTSCPTIHDISLSISDFYPFIVIHIDCRTKWKWQIQCY